MSILQEHKGKYTLTISPDIVKKLGWEKGQKLFLHKEREVLIIEKL